MSLWRKKVTPTKRFYNDLVIVDSDWTVQGDGSLFLDQNLATKVALVKLNDLPIGSLIHDVTGHLGVGADTGGSKDTIVTLSVRRVINKAGGVTDAELDASAATTYTADTKVDLSVPIDAHVVADGYSYYLKVTVTTENDATNDANLIGATVTYQ